MPPKFALKTSPVLVNKPVLSMMDGFNGYHDFLKGAPGKRVSDIEFLQNTRRVRYQNGAIYERPGGYAWVHGAIGERYNQLGADSSWLGLPVTDEIPMSEGGRANVFDRGTIYWWPDVGAIDLNEVLVHYTGLMCFGETDTDGTFTSSDEPYAVIGVVTPRGSSEIRSQIYDDVDDKESRPDLIELYKGPPQGMTLSVLLMEHDTGDPDKYRAIVGKAVDKAMDKLAPVVAKALGGVPAVGPVLALAASEGLPLLTPAISDFLNSLLGTDDEVLGWPVINITAKEMIVLSARTMNSEIKGVLFKVETPLISSQGASYKVYFGLVTA